MTLTQVPINELRKLCQLALCQKGATQHEADIVFEDYLDAELRGRKSHGFISFPVALSAFPHAGSASVEVQSESVILVNGDGDCGHTVARSAIDEGVKRLVKAGVVAIGIRDITRFNSPGPIARYGANKGAITIVLEYGGQNFMAPYGGKEAALSTNPIGIAVPGPDPIFVLDIATSERAFGFVSLAKLSGNSIPSTWGIDASGQPTSDPAALKAVSPFGGYKGYSLALAFEILSGALVGVPIGKRGNLSRRGALVLLLSPSMFGSEQAFTSEVRAFLEDVMSTAAVDPMHPVTYPGKDSEVRLRALKRSGVLELPDSAVAEIRKAAQSA